MARVELGEVLSDHKPVVLEERLQGERQWGARYYKINTSLVSTLEGKRYIEEALKMNTPWLGIAAKLHKEFRQLGKEHAAKGR
eukprot:c30362_g1_i1 orf=22-270(+)